MTDPEDARDEAFVAMLRGQLEDAAEAERDQALGEAFRALPERRRRRVWPYVAVALAAGIVAAVATWLAVGGAGTGGPHPDVAFDGGARPGDGAGQAIRWDATGRLAESELGGERLVFRSGRLVRIEHGPKGKLDGQAVDLDGAGRVVRIETWVEGRLTERRDLP